MAQIALAKWGNNLAIRLPRSIVEELGVKEGSEVSVVVEKGSLVAKPVRKRPKLKELIAGINSRNRHQATDWGAPVGKEVW